MDARRIVPDVVQRILAVGGEDVFSISLVTGEEPYFLVDVSGDNAATMIARCLWPDLPGKEGVYYLTVEGRVPALLEGNEDETVPVIVSTRPMSVLLPDLESDNATYRRVYATVDARVPDHTRLAADLQQVAQALAAEEDAVRAVVEALATAHPVIARWQADQILPVILNGQGRLQADDLKRIACNLLEGVL